MPLLFLGRSLSPWGKWFGIRCGGLPFHLYCSTLRALATQAAGKHVSVICIDMCVVLTARYGHVRKTIINQQFAFVCVDVNQNSVCRLPLAAMAGDSVPVVKMRMLADVKSNLATRVHSDFEIAGMADLFDSTQFS